MLWIWKENNGIHEKTTSMSVLQGYQVIHHHATIFVSGLSTINQTLGWWPYFILRILRLVRTRGMDILELLYIPLDTLAQIAEIFLTASLLWVCRRPGREPTTFPFRESSWLISAFQRSATSPLAFKRFPTILILVGEFALSVFFMVKSCDDLS